MEYKHIRLTFAFVNKWLNLNGEWRKSIPIEEFPILLLAMGDGNHFASPFEYSKAFLHAPEEVGHKVLLAE